MRLLMPLLLITALPATAATTAAGPTAGTIKACLPLAQIRGTKVVDGQTIDFSLRDGSVWRSRLPGGDCAQLGFEKAFSYQTSMSQLCKQDVITVLQNMGGLMRGASCGLGEFVAQLRPAPTTPTR
jgi:hypothetical protein